MADKIIIRSYVGAWKINSKIYKIGNFSVPRPITLQAAGIFTFFVVLGAFILPRIIPGFVRLWMPLRVLILPFALTQLVDKMKFDGKPIYKYFYSLLRYFCTQNGVYVERFRDYRPQKRSRVKWYCSKGW